MKFVSAIRSLSVASVALAPLLTGCEADPEAARGAALVQGCAQAPVEVFYNNDFSDPSLAGFTKVVDKAAEDPGHTWTIVDGVLKSDPAGFTIDNYYNLIATPPVDLTGRTD